MKLVFFGGVQGIGKSTLLEWIENQFKGRVVLINPGELFRRYLYNEKIKTAEEVEEMIVDELEKMPGDSTVVIHWHYAVRRLEGFIPQISFSRLERMARSGRIERAVLLSMQASTDIVYERRSKDYKDKTRELSRQSIQEEIDTDEEFLTKHHKIFSEALGGENITMLRIINDDLCATQAVLYNFFASLLG